MSIADVLTKNNNLSLTNSIMESSRLNSDSDGSAQNYSMMPSKHKLFESEDDLEHDDKPPKFDNDSDNESNRELSHQVTPLMEQTTSDNGRRSMHKLGKRKFHKSEDLEPDDKRAKFDSESNRGLSHEEEPSTEQTTSDIGRRLMQKMGYSEGRGLGKYEQGRVAPVEAFQQKGRRGLGHDNKKLTEATLKWDPSAEVVDVHENMLWLDNSKTPPSLDEMESWIVLGRRPDTIDNETMFCDPQIVQQVVNSKTIFDTLDKNEMHRARSRSNPYETIRGAFFLNRAAVKMANIDKACNFMFTRRNIDSNETLYFADVCAGPGGFSEYVLWRTKWGAKGFGFTLRDSNDFKLEDFYAASPETFHPFYGPKEDGNVYDPDNQQAFKRIVMQSTRNKGLHFMMADGGFSVDGQENIQEILSKQLYLCQCLVALMIVREGGHFVTKLFDLFTPFSAGLVYLMHRCFKRVCIFKPNTSRPANSERYLICEEKLPDTEDVIQYLDHVNKLLLKKDLNRDVIGLVPLDILQGDENFFMYLKESNESLGSKQVVGLLKIAAYCEDPTLSEKRQAQMRKECLQYWELPDESRTRPRDERPDDRLQTIIGSALQALYTSKLTPLTNDNLTTTILSRPCNWFCLPCEAKNSADVEKLPTFYFSAGRTKVYRYVRKMWSRVENIELPAHTFIYAEVVTEMRGESRTQRRTNALHIIDAWFLGNKEVNQKYLPDRHAMIEQFCELLWSPGNKPTMRVRPKPLYSLDDDLPAVMNLKNRVLKNNSQVEALHPGEPIYSINSDDERDQFYIVPNSMIFLNSIKPPWAKYISRSTGYHYFFNSQTDAKFYDDRRPDDSAADFASSICSRIFWFWQDSNSPKLFDLNARIKSVCPGNTIIKSSK